MSITTSVSVSTTAITRKPSSPSSLSARPLPSLNSGVSFVFSVVTSTKIAGPLTHDADPHLHVTPHSNAKSHFRR